MTTRQIKSPIPDDVAAAQVFVGDNLSVLRSRVRSESIDLIYLDPPFNSAEERVIETTLEGARRSFDDRFSSIESYVEWMRPRLIECERILRPGGALFLHCDWRTSHYLRVELDRLLGYDSLVNEIIWQRHSGHNDSRQGTRHFGRNADTILFYGKGERRTWHPVSVPYDPSYVARTYRYVEEESGRRYALSDLSGPGGSPRGNPVFTFSGVRRAWRYSKTKMEALDDAGRIVVTRRGGVPRMKRYLDEMPGQLVQSVWTDIPCLRGNERVAYPTQKPLALLTRIISSSTDEDAVVLDPFCGSGTTLVAALALGRRAIGVDSSAEAVRIARQRLRGLATTAY